MMSPTLNSCSSSSSVTTCASVASRWNSRSMRRLRSSGSPIVPSGENNPELGELPRLAVDIYKAAVLLYDYVIAYRKPKPGAFPGRFGREEWIKDFFFRL